MAGNKANKKNGEEKARLDTDFGKLLSNARKAKNVSIEEASDYLKIPAQVITAIESSNIAELPPATFAQGYIRAYAKYLNASENKVLEMYNLAVPHEQATELKTRVRLPDETNSQSPLIKLITTVLTFAGIAAIIVGSYNYYQEKADVMESQLESREKSFTGNSLNSPASQTTSKDDSRVTGQRLNIKQNAVLTADDELIVQPDNNIDSPAPVTDVLPPSAESSQQAKKQSEYTADVSYQSIDIYAANGAWLEVYDASEQRLFYNMLGQGANKVLRGQAPFRVALGNADSTRILVNDVEIDMKKFIRRNNTASFMIKVKDDKVSLH